MQLCINNKPQFISFPEAIQLEGSAVQFAKQNDSIWLVSEAPILQRFQNKEEITLGRLNTCDIIMPNVKATRKHCSIKPFENELLFTDFSKNGTVVNNVLIKQGNISVDSTVNVKHNITIGDLEYTVWAEPNNIIVIETNQKDIHRSIFTADTEYIIKNTPIKWTENVFHTKFDIDVAEHVGKRSYMEDRYIIDKDAGIIAVFDGHGGSECSNHLQESFEQFKLNLPKLSDDLDTRKEEYNKLYSTINRSIYDSGISSGSTSTIARFGLPKNTMECINSGDSRIMLVYHDNTYRITDEHRPDTPVERERLKNIGAELMYRPHDSVRVKGSNGGGLSVSRGFGDIDFKDIVIPKPDIYEWSLDNAAFMLAASDGVWDFMSPEDIIHLFDNTKRPITAKEFANVITNYVINDKKGSDNVTAVTAIFPQ
tara:strand:- start:8975 stop:10252 length:1278 start_codon:yes stop_codon:yes gene_type:complete